MDYACTPAAVHNDFIVTLILISICTHFGARARVYTMMIIIITILIVIIIYVILSTLLHVRYRYTHCMQIRKGVCDFCGGIYVNDNNIMPGAVFLQ